MCRPNSFYTSEEKPMATSTTSKTEGIRVTTELIHTSPLSLSSCYTCFAVEFELHIVVLYEEIKETNSSFDTGASGGNQIARDQTLKKDRTPAQNQVPSQSH